VLIVAISTDITSLKHAQQALRESEERFRSLNQLSADWFWEQDETYRFTVQSGGGLATLKVATQDMIGKLRWEVPYQNVTEEYWEQHRAMLDARETFHDLEFCRLNDHGERRYVTISGEPVFDQSGASRATAESGTTSPIRRWRASSCACIATGCRAWWTSRRTSCGRPRRQPRRPIAPSHSSWPTCRTSCARRCTPSCPSRAWGPNGSAAAAPIRSSWKSISSRSSRAASGC
jgi:PAS domain-containing protein